ncbi:hypothetical protein D3C87_925300 [compost metagenome]
MMQTMETAWKTRTEDLGAERTVALEDTELDGVVGGLITDKLRAGLKSLRSRFSSSEQ